MKIALFGSGSPQSQLVLRALSTKHDVRAVVVPEPVRVRRAADVLRRCVRALSLGPLSGLARARGIATLRYGPSSRDNAEAALRALAPDVLVVASFPYLLGAETLRLAPRGAINVHPSLLPKHRGPDPLFWTYFDDDRETGVTVHRVTSEIDAGEILGQETVPLERGAPIGRTYARLSDLGAELILRAIECASPRAPTSTPPGGSEGVVEPRPQPGRPVLDPARLPSERVWHVLAGLGAAYPWLLQDRRGRALPHGPALGREAADVGDQAGLIERHSGNWLVHCADGIVRVAPAPFGVRLRLALSGRAVRRDARH